jgi:hypothetical protein
MFLMTRSGEARDSSLPIHRISHWIEKVASVTESLLSFLLMIQPWIQVRQGGSKRETDPSYVPECIASSDGAPIRGVNLGSINCFSR